MALNGNITKGTVEQTPIQHDGKVANCDRYARLP